MKLIGGRRTLRPPPPPPLFMMKWIRFGSDEKEGDSSGFEGFSFLFRVLMYWSRVFDAEYLVAVSLLLRKAGSALVGQPGQ